MVRLNDEFRSTIRVSYALRRVPVASLAHLLPLSGPPRAGDLALARVDKIGKNARVELTSGRNATLHEGDLLAVAFGNRYATQQFEGYAGRTGDQCDMLSMGGLCGLVHSKHVGVSDPTRLTLLGALGDAEGRPLSLRDHAVHPEATLPYPHVVAVCGAAMDSGKTHTAMSLVRGLRRDCRVAAVKLTGTAAGKDTWQVLDAGAIVALNFIDGGYESTYMCSVDELLGLHDCLLREAAAHGADWVVLEIADGLFQRETSALLQCERFTSTIDAWIFAGGDPMSVHSGVGILREWGIVPVGLSGLVSMSPLCVQEAEAATGIRCLTARELQAGCLNAEVAGSSNAAQGPAEASLLESLEPGVSANGKPRKAATEPKIYECEELQIA